MKKLLKFSATWCVPCKLLSETILRAGDKITVPIEDIDIDAQPVLLQRYGIRSVPTLVLIDTDDSIIGSSLKRITGNQTESKILDFINN